MDTNSGLRDITNQPTQNRILLKPSSSSNAAVQPCSPDSTSEPRSTAVPKLLIKTIQPTSFAPKCYSSKKVTSKPHTTGAPPMAGAAPSKSYVSRPANVTILTVPVRANDGSKSLVQKQVLSRPSPTARNADLPSKSKISTVGNPVAVIYRAPPPSKLLPTKKPMLIAPTISTTPTVGKLPVSKSTPTPTVAAISRTPAPSKLPPPKKHMLIAPTISKTTTVDEPPASKSTPTPTVAVISRTPAPSKLPPPKKHMLIAPTISKTPTVDEPPVSKSTPTPTGAVISRTPAPSKLPTPKKHMLIAPTISKITTVDEPPASKSTPTPTGAVISRTPAPSKLPPPKKRMLIAPTISKTTTVDEPPASKSTPTPTVAVISRTPPPSKSTPKNQESSTSYSYQTADDCSGFEPYPEFMSHNQPLDVDDAVYDAAAHRYSDDDILDIRNILNLSDMSISDERLSSAPASPDEFDECSPKKKPRQSSNDDSSRRLHKHDVSDNADKRTRSVPAGPDGIDGCSPKKKSPKPTPVKRDRKGKAVEQTAKTPQTNDKLLVWRLTFCIKNYRSQRNFLNEQEVTLSGDNLAALKSEFWEQTKSRLEKVASVKVCSDNGAKRFEAEWVEGDASIAEIDKFAEIYDVPAKKTYTPSNVFDSYDLVMKLLRTQCTGVVWPYSASVLTPKHFDAVREQLLVPTLKDRAGAAANALLSEVTDKLKEKHGGDLDAFQIHWNQWARHITSVARNNHSNYDAEIEKPPPAHLRTFFQPVPKGTRKTLEEVRSGLQVAINVNDGHERYLKQHRVHMKEINAHIEELCKLSRLMNLNAESWETACTAKGELLRETTSSMCVIETEEAHRLSKNIGCQEDVDHV